MGLIIKLALRNLLRQKRRNILLGIVIAFGVTVLVMANSLGNGMVEIIIEKYMMRVVGHLKIQQGVKTDKGLTVMIKDKTRFITMITNEIKGVKSVNESIQIWTSGIGNGKSTSVYLIGVETNREFTDTVNLGDGSIEDFLNPKSENPVIISKNHAKKLNVTLHDTIRIKSSTIYGQVQTARLWVAGITKSDTTIMGLGSVYIRSTDLKAIRDIGENESSALMIALSDTSQIKEVEKKLDAIFAPAPIALLATLSLDTHSQLYSVLSFQTNGESLAKFAQEMGLKNTPLSNLLDDGAIVVSESQLKKWNKTIGDTLTVQYQNKAGVTFTKSYTIAGSTPKVLSENDLIFIGEVEFYRLLYENGVNQTAPADSLLPKQGALYPLLTPEWRAAPKFANAEEIERYYGSLVKEKWRGSLVQVTTMYEEGTFILQYADIISMVTVIGVIILFLVTQIGVVNTLRMSIKERTREIGTIRSIGMQKWEVGALFITETLMLAIFASVVGFMISGIFMALLSMIFIESDSIVMSMFSNNGYLHFVVKWQDLVTYFIVIICIAFVSALFPARKAAKISCAEALQHFE